LAAISIIIPVFNESAIIESTLQRIRHDSDVELIVVDGGSQDKTVELVQSLGVKVINSPQGRANQMNFASAHARGEILLFLHGDTYLPKGYQNLIKQTLSQPNTLAGAFLLGIDGEGFSFRIVERLVNWRSRFLSLPYGDQGIFLKTSVFREMGGFANLPIMEDFEFIQRLKKRGKIRMVPAQVLTSGRRWKKLGVCRTTLINQLIIIGYYLGIAPDRLARLYIIENDDSPQRHRGHRVFFD
jgi:rSAM/selenodomain-associated transferase 2